MDVNRITVLIEVKEVVGDVVEKAHLTGVARRADGSKGYESVSTMQASDDEDSRYLIRRSFDTAFALLKSELSEFLCDYEQTSDNLVSPDVADDGVLMLYFKIPSNYNRASTASLIKHIHAYLVDTTLGDWFAITNREDAEYWVRSSVANLGLIKRALYSRSRPQRPI